VPCGSVPRRDLDQQFAFWRGKSSLTPSIFPLSPLTLGEPRVTLLVMHLPLAG
jgi:hypothetical protein